MNKAEKSLRWVVNQIPDFKPTTNEEKMLVAIKLYSEAGAEEIKRLEAENAELKDQWDNLRCVYSYNGDVLEYCVNGPCPHDRAVARVREENDELKERLSQVNEECLKWHERAQNLIKENGGSISGYEKKISDLQAENAALRERLEKAVEHPFYVFDKKTGKEADAYEIALNEDWAKHLMYCDMDGFAIEQDGTLILIDECGQLAYCPSGRFEICTESRLKELQGEKK